MNWNNKNVLVTGAGGFIGSHLVEELLNLGANVTSLFRYTSEKSIGNQIYISSELMEANNLIFGNVEDGEFMHAIMKDQDVVFHLAALIGIPFSYIAPKSYVSTNIIGTLNILNAMKYHGIEIGLATSTSEVYGTAEYVPIDEKHPLKGQSPYSATKIGADKLVESYYLSFDIPIGLVRPFNTFGPRQSDRAVIPTIISQALYSNTIKLGDVTTTRDYVYVKDTAHGFIKLAENPVLGHPVNLATGQEHSIKDITEMVISEVNPNAEVVIDKTRLRPQKSEVRQLLGDASIAIRQGWKPTVSFEEGLKKTIEWFRTTGKYSNTKKFTFSV